ncbi:MAG: DUF4249 family protein [Candidatus Hatepunaea meridiana]|nr:DUF4249 family protein [Candidatus Hatepunaea meridiana]
MKSISFISLILSVFFGLILMILTTGCETTPTEVEKYEKEAVLTAFLTNGEPVSEVFLERIASIFDRYDFSDAAITGADIKIFDLNGSDTLHFQDDPVSHGRYIPVAGDTLIPLGKHSYRIEASIPNGEFLWSETVVPDAFTSLDIVLIDEDGTFYPVSSGDTLTRNDPYMFWRWSSVDSAGGYLGLIVAETPRDSLVPLDPNWDPNDPDDEIEDENRERSGDMIMRNDATTVSVPWIFFNWEGPNRIELRAISHSYYEYKFSLMRVEMGMLENPIFNINGGLGIFAGSSKVGMIVYLKRVEEQ